jgi:hypothetical protein
MEGSVMMSHAIRFSLLAAILMLIGMPTLVSAGQDTVLQVVAVEVEAGKLDKYVESVSKFNGIAKRLGLEASLRIWEATMAGTNTGTVIVGVLFPNLAAFAEASVKLDADSEWQKLISDLDDIRKIVSNSLYQELTP